MPVVKGLIAVAIGIVFAVLIGYSVNTYYDEPIKSIENFNVYLIVTFIGLFAIIVGVLLYLSFNIDGLDTGFILGGIFLLLYGTMRVWRLDSDYMKIFTLFFVLLVLISITVILHLKKRKLRDKYFS